MSFPCRPESRRTSILVCSCLLASVVLVSCSSVFQGEPAGGNGGPRDLPTLGEAVARGEPGSAIPYEHPTGAQDVLVSIDVAGGYVPLEVNLRNTAEFLLLGDGTVIAAGVTDMRYPGPAINPLQTTTISEAQIQELLAGADAAGLLGGEVDYGYPAVTDLPDTSVDITVGGSTSSQSAYALGFDDGTTLGLSDSQIAAREALQNFIDTAQALVQADSEPYAPEALVAYRLSAQAAPPIEEPDLVQEPRSWPIPTLPPPAPETELSSCVVIAGQEAAALLIALQEANELTPWLIGSEPPARMAFRPLLPGDPGCEQ